MKKEFFDDWPIWLQTSKNKLSTLTLRTAALEAFCPHLRIN